MRTRWLYRFFAVIFVVILLASVAVIARVPVQAQSGAAPIKYGDSVQGEITKEVSQIAYKFTGKKGDVVIAMMQVPSADAASDNLIPAIRIQDADGKAIADTNLAQTIAYIPVPGAQVAAQLPAD